LIEDNGTGIDDAHCQRIFGLFERAASADIPGTGIGLAIVKKAVERMGGTVGVRPGKENGCVFWFDLEPAMASGAPNDGSGSREAELLA
jgi:signal transduction histidine kinase